MKPRGLLLFFIFAVLVITVAGTWAARTQIASIAITSALQRAGLNDVSTDIQQLDTDHGQLSRFAFSFINESNLFQFEAQGINISYNLRQLAASHVDSVTIDKLVLRHENRANTANGSPDTGDVQTKTLQPLEILAALQQASTKYLIFNSLSIKHITLHGESFSPLQERPLQLNSSIVDNVLSAELTLLDETVPAQQDNLRQLLITAPAEDSLTAELRFSAAGKPATAKIELHIQKPVEPVKDLESNTISGNYQIDPEQLQLWLQPFAVIENIEKISKVDGTLFFSLSTDGVIAATITAATDKAQFGTVLAESVVIKMITTATLDNSAPLVKIQKGSYIKAGNITQGNLSLATSPLSFTGELFRSNGDLMYKGNFRTDALTVDYPPKRLQLKELAASISADNEKLKISGELSPVAVPGKFSFTADHHFSDGRGQLAIKPVTPLDLNAEDNRLSQLVTPWTYPFDLLTGKIKIDSHAVWSPQHAFRLTANIKLEDGGGTMADDIVFSGLAVDHELELLPKLHSISAGKIELKHLDSGVTSSNISTRLNLRSTVSAPLPQLVVQGLHGEIFGGSFSGDDFIFDLNRDKNHLNIHAKNIDLAKIVETQQLESIQVTGRVDGTIPVEINEQGILIEHGALVNAVRAGTIRYDPGAGSEQLKQNPLTGIALDALKDFRYSYLSADVNFIPEGTLTVNLQLKGTSPKLDTDRPVHLNINTEQNLTALLKSLRFAQGLSDNIDKKVRQQYEKSTIKNKPD